MKLYVHLNPEHAMTGYTNLCVGQSENVLEDLDTLVDDAEATEIILDGVLEYIALANISKTLDRVIRKLRHAGTLIITGIDAYTVADHFSRLILNVEEFNVLLHGESTPKLTTLTQSGVLNYCKNIFGLIVVSQSFEEYTFVIKVKRP